MWRTYNVGGHNRREYQQTMEVLEQGVGTWAEMWSNRVGGWNMQGVESIGWEVETCRDVGNVSWMA